MKCNMKWNMIKCCYDVKWDEMILCSHEWSGWKIVMLMPLTKLRKTNNNELIWLIIQSQLNGLDDVRVAQVIQMGINLFHSVGLIFQTKLWRFINFKRKKVWQFVQTSIIINHPEADSSSILPFSLGYSLTFPNWSSSQHNVSCKVSHSQQFYLDTDPFDGSQGTKRYQTVSRSKKRV